jgi:hypothetical protein
MTSPFGRRKDRSRFRGMESISDFGFGDDEVDGMGSCYVGSCC